MVLRNKENMLQYYNNGTTEKASLEPVFNYFWNIPNINVYIATVPDRMHPLDLSLYRYQIEFTKKLLFEAEGRSLVDKMNWRITLIPRYPELKIFSGGLQSIALLTADNYRNIMKVMVFVVDDLLNKDLSEVYVNRQETFKESDLKNFQEAIEKWANLFIKLFVHHIVDTIREFGAINGYTTETYEALHKTYVKISYRLTEGRSLVDKMNWRITLIPRYPELKIFSGGLQSIALLTADNYRNIMKVMVFVVDDLLNKDLSEVYVNRQETFKESDLKNFQEAIEKWANLFIKLFVHHIVDTIREFGAINGYTTETYEALHKTYVKISYRLSNKKDVKKQMIKTIQRKAIIKQNDFKKKFKTPLKFNYSSKLFEFDISEVFEFIDKYKNKTNLDEKMIKGLDYFIQSLDSYFDLLKISTAQGCHIKIYRSVTLENRAILRTTNMFHKRPWFSNISVTMNDEELFEYQSDNGICYAQ
ncbi:hypothetical protein Glove_478g113 [Diversispora epigaea]|uniref:Uncharacterized protein n=1 Tax=Diversispora epigaea TaxID=1348612 RepID=A0A397GKB7_9GLOM|nr:hypothetical protein Glove_478g113 [Diversispora epigaea]